MNVQLRRTGILLVGSALLVSALAGCGSTQTQNSSQTKKLVTVTLATLPVPDAVPAVIAQKKGFFKQEGLNVKLDLVQSGSATTSAIVSGATQFSQSNYATLIQARSRGIPVEIVSEATRALPQFSGVMVLPNSPITSLKDLVGKRIATSEIGAIGPLAIDVQMKAQGLDYKSIKWVQVPFPNMGAALQEHQVDAAWVVEPFETLLTTSLHARNVLPVFSGPTANLPVAAFATSETYAKAHPQIINEFRKAIEKASALAEKDPGLVRQILPTYTSIKPQLAAQVGLEQYPTQTSLSEIERVSTFMRQVGFLTGKLNVSSMVWK